MHENKTNSGPTKVYTLSTIFTYNLYVVFNYVENNHIQASLIYTVLQLFKGWIVVSLDKIR